MSEFIEVALATGAPTVLEVLAAATAAGDLPDKTGAAGHAFSVLPIAEGANAANSGFVESQAATVDGLMREAGHY